MSHSSIFLLLSDPSSLTRHLMHFSGDQCLSAFFLPLPSFPSHLSEASNTLVFHLPSVMFSFSSASFFLSTSSNLSPYAWPFFLPPPLPVFLRSNTSCNNLSLFLLLPTSPPSDAIHATNAFSSFILVLPLSEVTLVFFFLHSFFFPRPFLTSCRSILKGGSVGTVSSWPARGEWEGRGRKARLEKRIEQCRWNSGKEDTVIQYSTGNIVKAIDVNIGSWRLYT